MMVGLDKKNTAARRGDRMRAKGLPRRGRGVPPLLGGRRNRRSKTQPHDRALTRRLPAQREASQVASGAPSRPSGADSPRRIVATGGGRVTRALLLTLKLTLGLTLLAGVAFAGYWGYRAAVTSAYFVVSQLEFEGAERAATAELSELLTGVRGVSIFRVPMEQVRRQLETHPWVASASLSRHLPDTLRVELVEHTPRAAVLLGHLYLVNGEGEVFKRASMEELEGLAIITGIERLDYLNRDPKVHSRIVGALAALSRYQSSSRPPLSEIHVGDPGIVTFFLRQGGATIRMGRDLTEEKLSQLDSVLAALGPEASRARAVYLDHEQATNRVVVRMASYD